MVAGAVLMTGGMIGAVASPAASLATYRSVHDLSLDDTVPSPGVTGVTARMVTEFTGSECEGYTDQVRFVMQTVDRAGSRQTSDLRQTTIERADGHIEFDDRVLANNAVVERSRGTADRNADGDVMVTLTRPSDKSFMLTSDVVFPVEQLHRTLEAANEGKHFLALDLYSGDAEGETIYATSAVIGEPSDAVDDSEVVSGAGFGGLRHWPVTVAYYEQPSSADAMPLYVTSYVLYENGVIDGIRIAYADFTLVGKLTSLEALPSKPCP